MVCQIQAVTHLYGNLAEPLGKLQIAPSYSTTSPPVTPVTSVLPAGEALPGCCRGIFGAFSGHFQGIFRALSLGEKEVLWHTNPVGRRATVANRSRSTTGTRCPITESLRR